MLGVSCSLCRTSLSEFGGHVTLSTAWAKSLLCRMNYVKRSGTTKAAMPVEQYQNSYFAGDHRCCYNRGSTKWFHVQLGSNQTESSPCFVMDHGCEEIKAIWNKRSTWRVCSVCLTRVRIDLDWINQQQPCSIELYIHNIERNRK